MKTIFVTDKAFRGRCLASHEFPFDYQLKDLVKTLPEDNWCLKLKLSTLPNSDLVSPDLLKVSNVEENKDRIIPIRKKIIQKYPKPVSHSMPI